VGQVINLIGKSISQIQSVMQVLGLAFGIHVFNVVGRFGGLGDERSHLGWNGCFSSCLSFFGRVSSWGSLHSCIQKGWTLL